MIIPRLVRRPQGAAHGPLITPPQKKSDCRDQIPGDFSELCYPMPGLLNYPLQPSCDVRQRMVVIDV